MIEIDRDERFLQTVLGTMLSLGLEPDPWQVDVLMSQHKRLLLNCCRQAGKSTVVALLSVLEAIALTDTRVLIVAPSLRQSWLLFQTAASLLRRIGQHYVDRQTAHEL